MKPKRTLAEAVKIALGKEPDYEKKCRMLREEKERLNRTISGLRGRITVLENEVNRLKKISN